VSGILTIRGDALNATMSRIDRRTVITVERPLPGASQIDPRRDLYWQHS
jgi:hypothetical protein